MTRRQSLMIAAMTLAIAASIATETLAQAGWIQGKSPAKPRDNMASAGDFATMQVATDKPEQLMQDWQRATPGVQVSSISQTHKNQPVVTFIIFTGCAPDRKGVCQVTADFNLIDPSGKVMNSSKAVPIWQGYPPPAKHALELSSSAYGYRFENKDPTGIYIIQATATDAVSGKSLQTRQSIKVLP